MPSEGNYRETLFLFDLMSGVYRRPTESPSIDSVSLPKVLELASKNGVLYYAVNELLERYHDELTERTRSLLLRIKKGEEAELGKLSRTVKLIDEFLDEYLVFKTYKGYPHVTHDVDVIVKDLAKSIRILTSVGKVNLVNQTDTEAVLKRSDILNVHLYRKVAWCAQEFFDDEFTWENPRRITLPSTDISVTIPSVECEFLSIIAHANFEPLWIPLSDLVYLFTLIPKVRWTYVIPQVTKHSWCGAFYRTLSLINYIHEEVYSEPCIVVEGLQLAKKSKSSRIPLQFTLNHVIASFIEKKALVKFMTSLILSIRIFLNKETISRLKSRFLA